MKSMSLEQVFRGVDSKYNAFGIYNMQKENKLSYVISGEKQNYILFKIYKYN